MGYYSWPDKRWVSDAESRAEQAARQHSRGRTVPFHASSQEPEPADKTITALFAQIRLTRQFGHYHRERAAWHELAKRLLKLELPLR